MDGFGSQEEAKRAAEWIASFRNRPLDFVLAVWPWGVPGSRLEKRRLENWQFDHLKELQDDLLSGEEDEAKALADGDIYSRVHRFSTASGHGVGKTALVAMVIHWFVSTHPYCQAIITANTETQLSSKTWRELAVWSADAINAGHWQWTATRYKHRAAPDTWYASAIPWSESNPAAFAGAHERYVLVVFDEASGIAPIIWETIEGALSMGKCLFCAFGNPTEPEGGFFDTHNRLRARWKTRTVDGRAVTFANLKQIEEWKEDYGEDSDFFRVRVRGLFPKQSSVQYIDYERITESQKREIDWRDIPRSIPRVMGIDVARQGGDKNVVVMRQGRKLAKRIVRFHSRDLMQTADFCSRLIHEMRPNMVFVDGTGMGAGVVDRLRQLGIPVTEVIVGGKAGMNKREKSIHANLRSLLWSRMRDWLVSADIPEDAELATDLATPRYAYQKATGLELIESKDDIRARGAASPDSADALSMTFAAIMPARSDYGGSAEPEAV